MVAGNQTVEIAPLKDHQMLVYWSKLAPNFLIFLAFWLVQVRGGQLCEWSEAWRLQLGWCQRFRPEDRVRRRPNSRIPGMLTQPRISLEFFKALTNYQITDTFQLFKLILAKKCTCKVASLSQLFTLPRFTLISGLAKDVLKEAKVSGSSKVEPFRTIYHFWFFWFFFDFDFFAKLLFWCFISGDALQTCDEGSFSLEQIEKVKKIMYWTYVERGEFRKLA